MQSDLPGGPPLPTKPVAYIVGRYPSITMTFIDREIEALDELGVEIDVVSIRTADPLLTEQTAYREIAPQVHNLLPTSVLLVLRAHLYLLVRHPRRYLGTMWYLLSRPHPDLAARSKTLMHFGEAGLAAFHLRDRRHGHIHAHFLDRASTLALAVGRMLGLPYSLTAHANDIFVNPVMVREKIEGSEFTVTVSEFNRRHLLDEAPGMSPERLVVLHPWVDSNNVAPREPRPESPELRIVSVGRLVEKKGHRYLIEACGMLADRGIDVSCTIVGAGPLENELAAQVEDLGLSEQVALIGAVPSHRIPDILLTADVFALACVVAEDGDRDGIPVSIAEAMSMAIPVVSTELVGIAELVRPGSGLLALPGDARSLAAAIETIATMPRSEREKMGAVARQVIEHHFDLRSGVRVLAEMYARASLGGR